MADSQGNDVTAVAIPVTGFIGYAPAGTPIPTPTEGSDPDFTLDPAFKKLGLLKTDGGPQWAWAPSGDALEFWQAGYKIPTGLADVTVDVTLAQTDDNVRAFTYGKTPDPATGFVIVDGGGSSEEYVIFTEEIFKNGDIRRRVAPSAQVTTVAEDRSERGAVLGYATTIGINASDQLANGHFGEWLILAGGDNS